MSRSLSMLVAVRVGVAGRVEPVRGHPLAVVRATPAAGRRPSRSASGACRRGSSTSAGVGGRPVRSSVTRRIRVAAVGLRRRLQPFALQPREDEGVDRVARPVAVLDLRQRRPRRRRRTTSASATSPPARSSACSIVDLRGRSASCRASAAASAGPSARDAADSSLSAGLPGTMAPSPSAFFAALSTSRRSSALRFCVGAVAGEAGSDRIGRTSRLNSTTRRDRRRGRARGRRGRRCGRRAHVRHPHHRGGRDSEQPESARHQPCSRS